MDMEDGNAKLQEEVYEVGEGTALVSLAGNDTDILQRTIDLLRERSQRGERHYACYAIPTSRGAGTSRVVHYFMRDEHDA